MNGARNGRRQIIMIKADWQLNELLYFSLTVDSKSQMFFNNNLKVEAYQGNVLLLNGLIVSSGPRWAFHKMVGTNKKEKKFLHPAKIVIFLLSLFFFFFLPCSLLHMIDSNRRSMFTDLELIMLYIMHYMVLANQRCSSLWLISKSVKLLCCRCNLNQKSWA